jgi:hypothetical protein
MGREIGIGVPTAARPAQNQDAALRPPVRASLGLKSSRFAFDSTLVLIRVATARMRATPSRLNVQYGRSLYNPIRLYYHISKRPQGLQPSSHRHEGQACRYQPVCHPTHSRNLA